MASSIICPPALVRTWCPNGQPMVMPSRPNIFDLPGMLAWTVINWLMHALAGVVAFISQTVVNYGFFSVIDSPPYQFLYGLIRDIGFMILALMMLAAISFAVFPKANKQYSAASLVRVMVSSCIALIMLVTRIPLVAMQLIFYTANKLTTTLLAVGTHGILQTLINQGGLVNGMKILVIGLLMHYGLGLGFLYFFLLVGVLLIFVFGLLIQVLGQIAGLVLTLFLPLALATYNFDFGKKWTRALFEFTAVAAFAQVLSTVYLLFVLVLVTNCFSASPTNPLQLLVTLGMAVLSIIPAKHLITEFAGMIHSSGGAMIGHADYVQNHPTTAKLGGMLTGKTTGGNGSTAPSGSGGRGSTVGAGIGAGVATGTVAAGLLADHVDGATSSVTSVAGSGSSGSNGSTAPSSGSGSNGGSGGSSGGGSGGSGVATMNLHDDQPKPPPPRQTDGQVANAESPNTDPIQKGGNPPPPVDAPLQKPKPSIAGVVSSARSAKDKIAQTQAGTFGTAAVRSLQSPNDPLGAALTSRAQFKARGQANMAKDKERLSQMLDRLAKKPKPTPPQPSTPPPAKTPEQKG